MSDVQAAFHEFFRTLPAACGVAVNDYMPRRQAPGESSMNTQKNWEATMRPYATSIMWLVVRFWEHGSEAAKTAYLKLGAERRAFVQIGYAIVFGNTYEFAPGYVYTRPEMFVGVGVRNGAFPVRTLANMRLATYRRVVEMGEVVA